MICSELHRREVGPSFVCLCDPVSVSEARAAGLGNRVELRMGGKTDRDHGEPLAAKCRVIGFYDGKFREPEVRHGGFSDFDQGETAVVETDHGLTVMLTSLRMPPFSLEQLVSCQIDPANFRVIIAKGVIAPLAAYAPVCDRTIHVNTDGATCADMKRLDFQNRRRPMFPFEA